VKPFTTVATGLARVTGQDPFVFPKSWTRAHLDPATPFNLCTDNDIVGGNSGSPLIDAKGRLVGLIFDGNIHSIAGSYWFDPANNRAVAVHAAILKEALEKAYGATWLVKEMSSGQVSAASGSQGGNGGAAHRH
jgi:S1-C subfamily serine protease